MSYNAVEDVLDHADLANSGARVVLISLAEQAHKETRECYPGIARLAWRTQLSTRMVQNHIKSLIEAGFITCAPNAGPKGTNLYRVLRVEQWRSVKPPFDNRSEGPADAKHTSPCSHTADAQSITSYAKSSTDDAKHTSPEPSVEPSGEPLYMDGAEIISLNDKRSKPSEQGFSEADFLEFWKLFPDTGHKNNPDATRSAFKEIVTGKKKVLAQISSSGLVDAARSYAGSSPRFAMKPLNWLREEAWASYQNASPRRRGSQAIPYFGEITR